MGTIEGAATRSFYDSFRGERRFEKGTYSIARDSIASIGENHFDLALTIAAVLGVVAPVALVANWVVSYVGWGRIF
jgi:hypothetical protein